MKNLSYFNNLFGHDRKILYIILSIVMISVLTLTVVYATLSSTLNINGNAEISAASWDIYLDNVQLNSNSATTNVPTITDSRTASFSTTLSKPGDYYMFTIDVVNNGSVDAMIDSVTNTPELSDTQKKYLNYIVEYQNGESVTTKQLVSKNSFVRLKVKVEFRKDITASTLPTTSETINLSFKVNYVQSDDNNENVTIDNNGKLVKVMSGNYDTIGSEICIDSECFYVISSDENSVTMLTKYNLYLGYKCNTNDTSSCISHGEEATGLQDPTMIGYGQMPKKGTIIFSSTNYWSNPETLYPAYVYNEKSDLYHPIEKYKLYLENLGITIKEARLLTKDELEILGCKSSSPFCNASQYNWIDTSSYWIGTATSGDSIWSVARDAYVGPSDYALLGERGVRPVIKILK